MVKESVLGYVIMAARAAHLNVQTEEKLVDAMRKVLDEQLPSDAVELYQEWTKHEEVSQ